jgi:YD repeat-containing protein
MWLAAVPAGAAPQTGTTSSGSNAANYGYETQLTVNQRTADLTLQAELASLPGIVDDVGVSVTLSYSSGDATSDIDADVRYFGLPFGWKYNISYLDNRNTYVLIELDGTQSYTIDSSFRTEFTPTGSTSTVSAYTGLLQYNRADANFRSDPGTVTVGGITSAYVMSNLDGMARYFSSGGLLLETVDRFGNAIQYSYQTADGQSADGSTSATNALVAQIVDSWGNPTTFSYCDGDDGGCTAGQVTITLPDGRTTSFVIVDEYQISQITSPSGLVTVLGWIDSPCAHGEQLISSLTSAAGGFNAVTWTCINVCTAAATTSCLTDGNSTTWPVVANLYECPNNASGTACPAGESDGAFLSTQYALGTSTSANNYTGFPLYSPYAPTDPLADALMSSNDTAFVYTTVVSHLYASSAVAFEVESDFNFLHLKTDTTTSVRAEQSDGTFGLSPTKTTSYCYATTSATPASGCPTDSSTNYQALPAAYQLPIIVGSCAFPVDDVGESDNARVSVATRAYDSFGNVIHAQHFFGTVATAVVADCDRAVSLDPTPLQLVADSYLSFDTPTSLDSEGYVAVGPGSGHYGIGTGHQLYRYVEPQEDAAAIFGAIGTSTEPSLVQLACNTLGAGDTTVATTTRGQLSTGTAAPTTIGTTACAAPTWDTAIAAPKQTAYTYDGNGRILTQITSWAAGATPPDGSIASISDTLAYTLTATEAGEESCGDGNDVLQTDLTDGQGNVTQTRVCTLNGFPLSMTDAAGNTRTMTHDAEGLTTQVTFANGAYVSYGYYYQCPTAQDGSTATCSSAILTDCPYDTESPARSCVLQTLNAGTSGSSYADGVAQASIKDGLGRVVALVDNLGGQSGGGYTAQQTRSTVTFDDLGLESSRAAQIGATDPLIYTTTLAYDTKLRPSLVCAPRGLATQFAYDDIAQQRLSLQNGIQQQASSFNDARELIASVDCAVAVGGSATSSGDCPTIAESLDTVSCSGDGGYTANTLHDGGGLTVSLVASGDEPGASVAAVQGTATFSGDLLQYAYAATATPTDGNTAAAITTASSWSRDLQGLPLVMDLSVTDAADATTTFASDTYTYNDIGETLTEVNKLSQDGGPTLQQTFAYTANRLIEQRTSYAGVLFQSYYDDMNRLVRYCYPSGSGSEGENVTYDPLTGSPLSVAHFTNPGACTACGDGDCGDVAGETITYTYTRFGKLASQTYSDGTSLQWGYDAYQRPVCFADAVATAAGSSCPTSPIDSDFSPSAAQLLTWNTYWPDSDDYRRGLPMSTCRGVVSGPSTYAIKCLDTDYYTPVDVGGSCDASLATVVGAYAGLIETEMLCTGGSCLSGTGTLEYQTTYLYDAHGRACSVQSVNDQTSDNLVLGTTYTYDQFDNLVAETSASDLDDSTASNFQTTYGYDGLMRLVSMVRADGDGDFLQSIDYTYDAASNVIQEVEVQAVSETPAVGTPTPRPTRTPGGCAGDCNGDGEVTIDELVGLVNTSLGDAPLTCPSDDLNGDGEIEIDELLVAVNNALVGCP